MLEIWRDLSALWQDAILFGLYLAPAAIIGAVMIIGRRPLPLAWAMVQRFWGTNLIFTLLIAVSVAVGVALLAQERGLRRGAAQAADKFDLIIAAPGDEITAMLAAVYLQPSDLPLLTGEQFQRVADHPQTVLAAPLAFGDSHDGAPLVGTTAEFVTHLAGELAAGRMFTAHEEVVVGARVDLPLGATFTPDHGVGPEAEDHHEEDDHDDEPLHHGQILTVVGRMAPTGSPWDHAVLLPVETVWALHGLATGHAFDRAEQIGPPFDAEFFPGTPAILARAERLYANYALRAAFDTDETMAFFPGATLARLNGLLGDVRKAMSVLAMAAQALTAAAALTGLALLTRLYAQRLALLRALGAPKRFIFAVIWSHAALLIGAGTALGVGLGVGASALFSHILTDQVGVLISAGLGWPELHLAAMFFSLTVLLALAPAAAALRRPVVADLRT